MSLYSFCMVVIAQLCSQPSVSVDSTSVGSNNYGMKIFREKCCTVLYLYSSNNQFDGIYIIFGMINNPQIRYLVGYI